MMNQNKENFLKLVSETSDETIEKNRWRIKNRFWLKYSQRIAILILMKLEELGWDVKKFSEEGNVYLKNDNFKLENVEQMVKGSYNFSLEEICILEELLSLKILN